MFFVTAIDNKTTEIKAIKTIKTMTKITCYKSIIYFKMILYLVYSRIAAYFSISNIIKQVKCLF